ncbi:hypothetical protein HPB51_018180 [Rhipicephalus microplus]|uniref:Uncharacterized protein n=1 Tax=Rhipicephalus microplus TaxID=6941 RepID=A0A9J6D617_RHIMP|nr:hypothetical protein HPB51_018177 [Rhipicephalus microplus]KAH8009534.1 hypothetical protein HPB51_018180 [Rhipicephalus microplus]
MDCVAKRKQQFCSAEENMKKKSERGVWSEQLECNKLRTAAPGERFRSQHRLTRTPAALRTWRAWLPASSWVPQKGVRQPCRPDEPDSHSASGADTGTGSLACTWPEVAVNLQCSGLVIYRFAVPLPCHGHGSAIMAAHKTPVTTDLATASRFRNGEWDSLCATMRVRQLCGPGELGFLLQAASLNQAFGSHADLESLIPLLCVQG